MALTAMLLTAPAWADEGFTERDFIGDYAPHLDGVLTLSRAPLKREEKDEDLSRSGCKTKEVCALD